MVGVIGLTACGSSTPSNRRIAEDIIDSVDDLTDVERECMQLRLDGYTDEQLEAINSQNQNVDFSVENPDASPEWDAFVEDLASCQGVTSLPSDSSEPSGSTEAANGSTEATSGSTESSEATTAPATSVAATSEPTGSTTA